MKYFFYGLAILVLLNLPAQGKLRLRHLTVEQREKPLGLDTQIPRFGWQIDTREKGVEQKAWQIQVFSSIEKVKENSPDVWDSKQVRSYQQSFIPYAGIPLESARSYFWRVRIWDGKGMVSAWSVPAKFVTGILNQKEWEASNWIAYDTLASTLKVMPGVHMNGDHLGKKGLERAIIPYFRKPFVVSKMPKEAYLFVSGLGQYEARLNGEKIGDDFLAPGWTNYEQRCLYNTYDVTDQLQVGENVLGALVGTGFMYINRERYRKMVRAEAFPMLRARLLLRYRDGSEEWINTDGSWKTSPSPIIFSSIYGGEDYDARLEQQGWDAHPFVDDAWKRVRVLSGPQGKLHAQRDYPLKVMDVFDVVEKRQIKANQLLVDFGQNASGIIRLNVKGHAGDRVKIIPAEVLDDQGLPYQQASGSPYFFEYNLKGGAKEIWQPRFTYYGFRYALISCEGISPSAVEVQLLHTRNSMPTAGSFSCSNPLFNKINSLIKWGIQSNLASVATDCPHREKLGWLEQTHLIGASLKYNFDVYNLYNKIIDDMMEAQLTNGLVPDIVPEYVPFEGGFRDSPEWGSASIIIPWYLYQWYGDQAVLKKAYPMMKRYLTYLQHKADGHILSHGLGDWFDLGPKDPGVSQLTPIALTATATYFYDADLMAKIATALDKPEEASAYRALADDIKQAFNHQFYQKESGTYATGSQTAYAMPLYMGLVPDMDRKRVAANLIDSIKKNKHALTAGDVGYRYLLRALEGAGASQLIYEMNNRDDVPGYGYQLKHGATALTESWPALKYVSNNHMMLGHLMEWLYSGLGGIRQAPDDFGFRILHLEPEIVQGLDWVRAEYASINGPIALQWKKRKGKLLVRVIIPANTKATLYLPMSKESEVALRKRFDDHEQVQFVDYADGKAQLSVNSGEYTFTCF
ncbi:family 78 glycoside hydrolase catalytic domain [Olivibacter sp. CPCC 100613]|uniref:family 78 glycoside hydrolase catalytic domain n=1 Tax=Olivibacter sp. CPCC 100613 TaxID=3079931 RepID=UPI002FF9ED06